MQMNIASRLMKYQAVKCTCKWTIRRREGRGKIVNYLRK